MAAGLRQVDMSGSVSGSSDAACTASSGSSPFLAVTFFASVALLYLSLSPGVVTRMGYAGEEMRTGNILLTRWGMGSPTEIESPRPGKRARRGDWSRHGVLSVLLR